MVSHWVHIQLGKKGYSGIYPPFFLVITAVIPSPAHRHVFAIVSIVLLPHSSHCNQGDLLIFQI